MKLTPQQEQEVVLRVKDGELQKDLAVEFGVVPSTICKIVARTQVEPLTSEDFEIKPPPSKRRSLDLPALPQLSNKTERWLILPDMQIPYHDEDSLVSVLKYAQTQRWDGCIQLGDFMDWEWCSKWTKENMRAIEGNRFLAEYVMGNEVLDAIEYAVRKKNPKCQITILEGNHDWRVENVIDKTPALEGLIEMEKGLRLKERNITYWKYWTHRRPYIIGNAWFIHGEYIGANHAKKTADAFHRNVFYGHTHDRMSATKTTAFGDSVQCESMGTLSRFDLEYMGHKPSNWMQCFAEFYFRPDGNFNHYVTNVIDHSFTAIDGSFWHP
jgi:predicted phosphodiesterase